MDNLVLFPEDIYYGIKKIEDSIEMLEKISITQSKIMPLCEKTNIRISDINYSFKRIQERLNELLLKLYHIKKIMIEMDFSIGILYDKLDNSYNYIDDRKSIIDEEILDSIKGNNKDTGANVVLNTESIFNELKNPNNVNRILDMLKGNNEDTGSVKSLNVVGLVNGEMK